MEIQKTFKTKTAQFEDHQLLAPLLTINFLKILAFY
jgi:hypothetical protein